MTGRAFRPHFEISFARSAAVAGLEFFHRAVEHPRCVHQRAVRKFINECVREIIRERLRHGDGRKITVRQNEGGFRAEKFGEFGFELRVDLVVAGGAARGGDV